MPIKPINQTYDNSRRVLTTRIQQRKIAIIATGCSGQEAGLLTKITSNRSEFDARGEVAKGIELICEKLPEDTYCFGIHLGDIIYPDGVSKDPNEAKKQIQRELVHPYQKTPIQWRVMEGNHELACKGSGIGFAEAIKKGEDCVAAVQQFQQGAWLETQFLMPNRYYGEIIFDADNNLLATIAYIDSSLLPADREQQKWLQAFFNQIKTLDPNHQAKWLLASHHTFSVSVDDRGLKKSEGKKYSRSKITEDEIPFDQLPDEAARKIHGNQHQILANIMTEIGFPLTEIDATLQAHRHGNDVIIGGKPFAQFVLGGGGSWSNLNNLHVAPPGLRYSSNHFGPGLLMFEAANPSLHFSLYDSSNIRLNDPSTQQIICPYQIEFDPKQKIIRHEQVTGQAIHPILLKHQGAWFSWLKQALFSNNLSVIVLYLLTQENLKDKLAQFNLRQQTGDDLYQQFIATLPLDAKRNETNLRLLFMSLEHLLDAYLKSFSTKQQYLTAYLGDGLYQKLALLHLVIRHILEQIQKNISIERSVLLTFSQLSVQQAKDTITERRSALENIHSNNIDDIDSDDEDEPLVPQEDPATSSLNLADRASGESLLDKMASQLSDPTLIGFLIRKIEDIPTIRSAIAYGVAHYLAHDKPPKVHGHRLPPTLLLTSVNTDTDAANALFLSGLANLLSNPIELLAAAWHSKCPFPLLLTENIAWYFAAEIFRYFDFTEHQELIQKILAHCPPLFPHKLNDQELLHAALIIFVRTYAIETYSPWLLPILTHTIGQTVLQHEAWHDSLSKALSSDHSYQQSRFQANLWLAEIYSNTFFTRFIENTISPFTSQTMMTDFKTCLYNSTSKHDFCNQLRHKPWFTRYYVYDQETQQITLAPAGTTKPSRIGTFFNWLTRSSDKNFMTIFYELLQSLLEGEAFITLQTSMRQKCRMIHQQVSP